MSLDMHGPNDIYVSAQLSQMYEKRQRYVRSLLVSAFKINWGCKSIFGELEYFLKSTHFLSLGPGD